MPVRVRCPKCDKVLNAPDAARGKAVKCPDCQARISVPAGEEDSSGSGKSKSSKPPAKSSGKAAPAKKKVSADSQDFLATLDLSRSEDHNTRICPKCGAELDEEDVECAVCGIDLQTGTLGKTARKARMKWADPNDFYGLAWKDAYEFVKVNFPLTLKTWANVVYLMLAFLINGSLAAVFQSNGHTPSVVFFGALTALNFIAAYGWFLALSSKVISFTLDKKIELDRTTFEVFTAMATAISWLVWFVASAVPFLIIIFPVYLATRGSGPAINYGVTAAVTLFFVCLPVPCVLAHRAMPVNWMIWVSPLMWKVAVKTLGGVIYTWLIAFVTWIPVGLAVACELLVARNFLLCTMAAVGIKEGNLASTAAANGFPLIPGSIGIVGAIFVILLMLALRALTTFVFTVWAMYMLRVVAQFTFYNKRNLELVGQVIQKKYVAKEIEYGEDGEPIQRKSPAAIIAISLVIILVLFVATNAILFVTMNKLLLPRPVAKMMGLVKD